MAIKDAEEGCAEGEPSDDENHERAERARGFTIESATGDRSPGPLPGNSSPSTAA